MKLTTAGAVAAASMTALALAPSPAQARATYSMPAPKFFVSVAQNFVDAGCPEAFVGSPANGIDSVVVNVSSLAGKLPSALTWTGDGRVSEGGSLGGGITIDYYSAGCARNLPARQAFLKPGNYQIKVPAGAKWAVLENNWYLDVKVTF